MENRTGRCRTTMWCHYSKRCTLRPKLDLQKSLYGSETSCPRSVSTIRPSPRSISKEKPSKATKYVLPQSLINTPLSSLFSTPSLTPTTEAAMDANAPLEDSDDPAAGPIDSDEEVGAVMTALATWAPVPFLPQPVHVSVQRRYQIERLREQLDHASSGGRRNVFRPKREGEVVGNGQDGNAEGVGGGGGGPSVGVVA